MIELEARNVALLDAEAGQRLEAIGLDAGRGRGLQDVLPQADGIVGRDMDLIGKLARERHAQQAHRDAREHEVLAAHVGEAFVGNVHIGERQLQRLARLGARDRHAGPFVGERGHLHIELRPLHLQQVFEP